MVTDDPFEQSPDLTVNAAVMAVDQQGRARFITIRGMSGKMDLRDPVQWKGIQPVVRAGLLIGAADDNIVEVEQQVTAGPPGNFCKKGRFVKITAGEAKIGRGIFQQSLKKVPPWPDQARCSEKRTGS